MTALRMDWAAPDQTAALLGLSGGGRAFQAWTRHRRLERPSACRMRHNHHVLMMLTPTPRRASIQSNFLVFRASDQVNIVQNFNRKIAIPCLLAGSDCLTLPTDSNVATSTVRFSSVKFKKSRNFELC